MDWANNAPPIDLGTMTPTPSRWSDSLSPVLRVLVVFAGRVVAVAVRPTGAAAGCVTGAGGWGARTFLATCTSCSDLAARI